MLTKTTLFTARTDGYHNYRIPGLLCTGRGTLIATAEARRGSGGDWDGNDLLLRRSHDLGQNWEPAQPFASCDDYGPGPLSNLVLVEGEGGRMHALFCHSYARLYHAHSDDDGATFSAPQEITHVAEAWRDTYPWRVLATGPGHAIRLANGRLLVPVWLSDGSGSEFGRGKLGHRPSVVTTLYSDDGATWHTGDIIAADRDFIATPAPFAATLRNPSETVAVELDDGRVLCNIRSESAPNRRLVSISPDGATDWSPPAFVPDLLEPVCMASLIRLPQRAPSGLRYQLFANPANLENELVAPGQALAHDRKRLTIHLSADGGASWPIRRVLEPGPAGYSDLAALPDDSAACLYEDGMIERMTDSARLTFARFDLAWVLSGAG